MALTPQTEQKKAIMMSYFILTSTDEKGAERVYSLKLNNQTGFACQTNRKCEIQYSTHDDLYLDNDALVALAIEHIDESNTIKMVECFP